MDDQKLAAHLRAYRSTRSSLHETRPLTQLCVSEIEEIKECEHRWLQALATHEASPSEETGSDLDWARVILQDSLDRAERRDEESLTFARDVDKHDLTYATSRARVRATARFRACYATPRGAVRGRRPVRRGRWRRSHRARAPGREPADPEPPRRRHPRDRGGA